MISTLLCLALTGNFSQHNTYQSQTLATSTTELLSTTVSGWLLLTINSKRSILDVSAAQLLSMLLQII